MNRKHLSPEARREIDTDRMRVGEPDNNLTKPCRTCGEQKALFDYWRDRSRVDDPDMLGRQSACIDCSLEAKAKAEKLRSQNPKASEQEQVSLEDHPNNGHHSVRVRLIEGGLEIELPEELQGRDIFFVTRKRVKV